MYFLTKLNEARGGPRQSKVMYETAIWQMFQLGIYSAFQRKGKLANKRAEKYGSEWGSGEDILSICTSVSLTALGILVCQR